MNSVRFFFGAFARSASRKASISLSQRPGLISPKTGVVHKMTSQAAIIAGKAKRRFSIRPMSVARMLPIFSHLGSHLNAWPSAWFLASNRQALGQDSAHAGSVGSRRLPAAGSGRVGRRHRQWGRYHAGTRAGGRPLHGGDDRPGAAGDGRRGLWRWPRFRRSTNESILASR